MHCSFPRSESEPSTLCRICRRRDSGHCPFDPGSLCLLGTQQRLFANAPDLFAAVRAFCHDKAEHGQVPPEVSLQALVRGGYVSSNEARAFEGFAVTFSTHFSDEVPQLILARALAPDGQSICLLADGSIQQLSAER